MLLRHEGFRRLCQARDLLRELREPSPSIADLARQVQISPFHFIRQFEAVFGVTPHQWQTAALLSRRTARASPPQTTSDRAETPVAPFFSAPTDINYWQFPVLTSRRAGAGSAVDPGGVGGDQERDRGVGHTTRSDRVEAHELTRSV